jgi:hypothetical protein
MSRNCFAFFFIVFNFAKKAVRKLGSSASPSGRFEPPAKHYAVSKVEK